MACINPNSPEFKAALERTGNPLLAEIEVDLENVNYSLKAIKLLQSPKADQFFNAVAKNKISGDFFWKKMQADLGIPKEQIELLKQYNTTDRNELITNILADYSYAIEINVTKGLPTPANTRYLSKAQVEKVNDKYFILIDTEVDPEEGSISPVYLPNVNFDTKEEAENYLKNPSTPTSYYSNLTVPGGTNYTENEIATPALTPNIKGHAQFATDKGIGWFRSDDKLDDASVEMGIEIVDEYDEMGRNIGRPPLSQSFKQEGGTPTKTRRILEVQSDLFQKGRDKEKLVGSTVIRRGDSFFEIRAGGEEVKTTYTRAKELGYTEDKEKLESFKTSNQFLQLLNQGSNWVTFFVKSIIQDSSKKGYEKVLFPSGNTASKVEGHTTLEQFKKEKEDRIKKLEEEKKLLKRIEYVVSSR